jgi:hypothetical protein
VSSRSVISGLLWADDFRRIANKKPAGSSPAGLGIQKPIRGSQYIRGNPKSTILAHAKVLGAGLAAHRIGLRFERELLALIERAQTSAFDGTDVNENVISAVVGLNEAEAFGRVEPLNCSGSHVTISKMRRCALPARPPRRFHPIFNDVLGKGAGFGAVNKAER